MSEQDENKDPTFAVFAELRDYDRPLVMTGLSFARLMDEVIVPFEEKDPFFIDGVPVSREGLRKLKIIREKEFFSTTFSKLHWRIRVASVEEQKLLLEQYHTRLEALLRESGEDVTSQVIKAFNAKVRPRLKDYLPNREELIRAAFELFVQSMKSLAGG